MHLICLLRPGIVSFKISSKNLRGEMSMVGPRPCLFSQHELIACRAARDAFKVRPGITGLAQVNGLRGEIRDVDNMARRVRYDLTYIQNWSPALDLRILFQTAWIVFRDHEAY